MRVGPSPRKPLLTHRRRNRGVAWLAALTMTVLAVSPLLAIFHQISARHAVCEHGQLVESDHSGIPVSNSLAGNESARGDAEDAPTSDVRPDSDADRHAHSHCSVGTLAKNSAGLLAATRVVTVLSDGVAGDARPSAFSYARPVLFAAPKTSPPRALG